MTEGERSALARGVMWSALRNTPGCHAEFVTDEGDDSGDLIVMLTDLPGLFRLSIRAVP